MSIEIGPIDPHDESALRAWWEVGAAANALALRAAVSENSHDVWATVVHAAERHGLPARFLTDKHLLGVGRRHAGLTVTTIRQHREIAVFTGHQLIAEFTINGSRGYQAKKSYCYRSPETYV